MKKGIISSYIERERDHFDGHRTPQNMKQFGDSFVRNLPIAVIVVIGVPIVSIIGLALFFMVYTPGEDETQIADKIDSQYSDEITDVRLHGGSLYYVNTELPRGSEEEAISLCSDFVDTVGDHYSVTVFDQGGSIAANYVEGGLPCN